MTQHRLYSHVLIKRMHARNSPTIVTGLPGRAVLLAMGMAASTVVTFHCLLLVFWFWRPERNRAKEITYHLHTNTHRAMSNTDRFKDKAEIVSGITPIVPPGQCDPSLIHSFLAGRIVTVALILDHIGWHWGHRKGHLGGLQGERGRGNYHYFHHPLSHKCSNYYPTTHIILTATHTHTYTQLTMTMWKGLLFPSIYLTKPIIKNTK